MATSPTTNLRFEMPEPGTERATWGPKANNVFARLDDAIAGVASITTTGGSTTLSVINYVEDDSRKSTISVSGALTSAATLVVPDVNKTYLIINNTSGAFTTSVKTATGSSVSVPQGAIQLLRVSAGVGVIAAAPAVTISTGKMASDQLANGSILNAHIADNAVTGAKIADGEVSTAKLADGSVTTAKLGDSSVTTAKLGDSSVTTAKLGDGSVTTVKLGDDAVTSAKIADNAIGTSEIADGSITGPKLAAGAIGTTAIADGSITDAKITSLDAAKLTGVVPAAVLPSYVDDVLELANLAAFPAAGEAGKIYVAADTNLTYRWTGTVYVAVGPAGGGTDPTKLPLTGGTLTGPLNGTAITLSGPAAVMRVDSVNVPGEYASLESTGGYLIARSHSQALISAKLDGTSYQVVDGGGIYRTLYHDGNLPASGLADGAVTTAKIADANVTTAKLADGAVTGPKLGDMSDLSVAQVRAIVDAIQADATATADLKSSMSSIPAGNYTIVAKFAQSGALQSTLDGHNLRTITNLTNVHLGGGVYRFTFAVPRSSTGYIVWAEDGNLAAGTSNKSTTSFDVNFNIFAASSPSLVAVYE